MPRYNNYSTTSKHSPWLPQDNSSLYHERSSLQHGTSLFVTTGQLFVTVRTHLLLTWRTFLRSLYSTIVIVKKNRILTSNLSTLSYVYRNVTLHTDLRRARIVVGIARYRTLVKDCTRGFLGLSRAIALVSTIKRCVGPCVTTCTSSRVIAVGHPCSKPGVQY